MAEQFLCTCKEAFQYHGWNVYILEFDREIGGMTWGAIATKGKPHDMPCIKVPNCKSYKEARRLALVCVDEGKVDLGLEEE